MCASQLGRLYPITMGGHLLVPGASSACCCERRTPLTDVSARPITYPCMEVRILSAARPVEERRSSETGRGDGRAGAAHSRGVPLQVPEGPGDRTLMRGAHLLHGFRPAEGVEDAYGLRCGKGAVEGRDGDPAMAGIERLAARRIHAGEQHRQIRGVDGPVREAEALGEDPPPDTVGFDESRPIGCRRPRRLEVVRLASSPHLRHAQHAERPYEGAVVRDLPPQKRGPPPRRPDGRRRYDAPR